MNDFIYKFQKNRWQVAFVNTLIYVISANFFEYDFNSEVNLNHWWEMCIVNALAIFGFKGFEQLKDKILKINRKKIKEMHDNSFVGKWLADSKSYRSVCLSIASRLRNDGKPSFKIDPTYAKYVGNDNRSEQYFHALVSHLHGEIDPTIYNLLPFFTNNDLIGGPKHYPLDYHLNCTLWMSPGTLRFIKVLNDLVLRSFFIRNYTKVIEIGGGYGGQYNIIHTYDASVDYTIIDIPEALELIQAYLAKFDNKPTVINCEKSFEARAYDLCISDYCLGELNDTGIEFYIERIIKHCKYGYFTVNKTAADRVKSKLNPYFYLEFEDEIPQTHPVHRNVIIYATAI